MQAWTCMAWWHGVSLGDCCRLQGQDLPWLQDQWALPRLHLLLLLQQRGPARCWTAAAAAAVLHGLYLLL